MNYEEAIKQDLQSLLLTDKVQVSIPDETETQLTFNVVVGEGKKGGLFFSATVEKTGVMTAVDNCLMMIRSQLVLYAIECIGKGYQAKLDDVFIPNITDTILFPTVVEAQNYARTMATIVGTFNIFQGTHFNGDKIPRVAKNKPIKKVTKKTK